MNSLRNVTVLFATLLTVSLPAAGKAEGLTATVDPDGTFLVTSRDPAWRFGGALGRALTGIVTTDGTDDLGTYHEIAFDYTEGGARHASIRTYAERPAALFSMTFLDEAANTAPFPTLKSYPALPYHLAYRTTPFAPYSFSALDADSPWIYFDGDANTFVLSPAANFMVAATRKSGSDIAGGISTQIGRLPAGYTHQTLLTVGKGINRTLEEWGQALTDLQGKTRPASDADLSLSSLGYWTDNGAVYYYNYDRSLGYAGTLLAVRDEFARKGIPLAYLQLDSWFYPKGARADWSDVRSGIYRYTADATLFPDGLAAFQQQFGLPLMTHSRWIDPQSPYRQEFRTSGGVSPDPRYWDQIIGYIASAGVVTYEQDWLGAQAQAEFNLVDPVAFMDNMARACRENGLTMQYCMALPRHYLQGSRYDNLTTIRVSGDRFERGKWADFLYASRLASALGEWPWVDVFMSTEIDNLLLSVLSAGPVGVGDRLGGLNRDNLMQAVRADGVVVKPDSSLVPIDRSYLEEAQRTGRPLVASTATDFGDARVAYVFAYNRGADSTVTFRPEEIGFTGRVFLFDYFAEGGAVFEPGDKIQDTLPRGYRYYLLASIGKSGMALVGDSGKFVSAGRARLRDMRDDGRISATVQFAAGEESVALHGFAPTTPQFFVSSGSLLDTAYDPATGRFWAIVGPDSSLTAQIVIATP